MATEMDEGSFSCIVVDNDATWPFPLGFPWEQDNVVADDAQHFDKMVGFFELFHSFSLPLTFKNMLS